MMTAELIEFPALSAEDLAHDVDALAELQKTIAAHEKVARILRGRIREALSRTNIDRFTTPSGHRATLVDVNRWEADRSVAERILSPEDFVRIFRTTSSAQLRVK